MLLKTSNEGNDAPDVNPYLPETKPVARATRGLPSIRMIIITISQKVAKKLRKSGGFIRQLADQISHGAAGLPRHSCAAFGANWRRPNEIGTGSAAVE